MLNINNKPWNKLRFSDVQKLLDGADDETFFFEFKADGERPEKLIKEVSAFANTYGGYILLGIDDDKTISGCTAWTEQRIHNTIHNGIAPIPDFDVKKFKPNGNTVFIIKIEEGSMPPYVTNRGQIFERVSSGSFPIKDSSKLSQLYTKHQDNLAKLNRKIGIEDLRIHLKTPPNLCAYFDIGFEIQCMDMDKVIGDFFEFDISEISQYIRGITKDFSISSLGYSYVITLSKLTAQREGTVAILPQAAMNNFIEIMKDGSVKCRICLFSDSDGKAEVSTLISFVSVFKEIYSKIFKKNINKNFIYARKYEKLEVIKQFTPYFDPDVFANMATYLQDHRERYGNNLVLNSSRIPPNDFTVLDRRYFDKCGLKFDADSIIDELFFSVYGKLGYIDAPNNKENDSDE